jgi:hypothetical protein
MFVNLDPALGSFNKDRAMCRSPLAETICGAVPFETLAPHLVVWDDIGDTLPEFSTMMGIAKMAKLMHHDVVDDRGGSHDDPPVESESAVRRAATPPPLLGTNQHGSGLDAESRPVAGERHQRPGVSSPTQAELDVCGGPRVPDTGVHARRRSPSEPTGRSMRSALRAERPGGPAAGCQHQHGVVLLQLGDVTDLRPAGHIAAPSLAAAQPVEDGEVVGDGRRSVARRLG